MRRVRFSREQRTPLTERQKAVLDLIAAGKTNAEIGAALGISLDGAKWHVSEILTRLNVRTREQAAELWRRERSPRRRLAALLAAFRPAAAVGSVVLGGTVIAGVVIGVAVLLARPGDSQVVASSPVPTATATVTPASTETAKASNSFPDGPVAFTVCGETIGYRKLTAAEMQDVFTNKRFGDGLKPGPVYWAMYQSDYYWIAEPHAVSANVENVALSRGTATAGTTSVAESAECLTPDQQQTATFQELWLYDHHVVEMRAEGGTLVVGVESRPGSYERVQFPQPALPRSVPPAKNDPLLFNAVQIVDGTGKLLASLGSGASSWEYSDDGRVVSGSVTSAKLPGELALRAPTDLEFVCGGLPSAARTLTFVPDDGASFTAPAASCSSPWEVAAEVHLEAGAWRITLDSDAYCTVLPKDGPRP
jgi:DNA-binding CsgD family transcriptional regulator